MPAGRAACSLAIIPSRRAQVRAGRARHGCGARCVRVAAHRSGPPGYAARAMPEPDRHLNATLVTAGAGEGIEAPLRGGSVDTQGLRKLYREELRQTLDTVGGKTRKRTYTRMVRAVAEHRGEALTAPDEAVLVWSDLHLGHANIIEYQARPFFDVGDMDEELWRTWERVLQPESVLVLVGDVAMGGAVCEATWERIRRTPGRRKHLVIGNHDVTGEGEVRAQGFDGVWSVMTSAGEPPLLWTHYPLREVPEGHVNIHGHEHGRPRGGRRTSTSRSSSSSTSPSRSLGCGALRARSTADTTRRARRSSSGSPNSNAMPNDPEIVRTRVRVVSDLNVERQRPPPERVEKRQRESRAQTIRLPVETGAVDYAARDGAGARHMCYVPGEQPAALRDRQTERLSSERAVVRGPTRSPARDSSHGCSYGRVAATVCNTSDWEPSGPSDGFSVSRLLPPQGPRQGGSPLGCAGVRPDLSPTAFAPLADQVSTATTAFVCTWRRRGWPSCADRLSRSVATRNASAAS